MNDTKFNIGREALAAYAHEAWSGWMRYMFSKGTFREANTEDGATVTIWIMPSELVARWQRQMGTSYPNLSEREKKSDRAEADKMLAALEAIYVMLQEVSE